MKQGWILAVSLLLVIFTGSPASTQDFCNAMVYDGANIFGSKFTEVEEAAKKLVNLGAEVRVRTTRTLEGEATIDALEKKIERRCASWQSPRGGMKNNLVVLMGATDARKSGVFYGSEWSPSLDSKWSVVRTDFMNPRFRDGDWAGGMVKGLREISRLVNLQIHPPAQQPVAPIIVIPPQSQPQVVVVPPPSQPADLSGLWNVMMWIVILAAAGLAIVGLAVVFSRRKSETEKRRAAQQKAILARQTVVTRINDLPKTLEMLEIKVRNVAGLVSPEDAAPLLDGLAKAEQRASVATVAHGNLRLASPESAGMTAGEYEAIAAEYEKVRGKLGEADTLLKSTEQKADTLQKLITETPKMIADLTRMVEVAHARVAEVRNRGFKTTEQDELLARAASMLANAEIILKEKRYSEATQQAENAKEAAGKARTSAEEMSKKQQTIIETTAALDARTKEVGASIASAREVFRRISAKYASASWESIQGNGNEAIKRVDTSLRALDAARDASSMEKQEWTRAEGLLTQVTSWLDEAESLLRSIIEREKHLAQAEADAPQEDEAARAGIAKAWDYIHQYDDDIREKLEDGLRQAEAALIDARQELTKEKPDYPATLKLIKETRGVAEKIYLEACEEHERAELLREKARSAMRDAERAISKASEYIEDHRSDVGQTAKNYLSEAREYYEKAERATDLSKRVELAEEAASKGNKAYSKAKSDVDDANSSSSNHWGTGYHPSHHSTTIIVSGGDSGGYSGGYDPSPSYSPSPSYGGSGDIGFDSGGGGGGDIGFGGGGGGGGDI